MLDRGLVAFLHVNIQFLPAPFIGETVFPHWFLALLSNISWLYIFDLGALDSAPLVSVFLCHGIVCAVLSWSVVSDSATSSTVPHQGPLSMGILQARILEWVAMPSSRGSSQPRDRTRISCIAGGFFTVWATREAYEIVYYHFVV